MKKGNIQVLNFNFSHYIMNKKLYFGCLFLLVCFCVIVLLLLLFLLLFFTMYKEQQEEGFTPKIRSFYNSNLRKARKHLETKVFDSSLYKRGAVPLLRYFSIY